MSSEIDTELCFSLWSNKFRSGPRKKSCEKLKKLSKKLSKKKTKQERIQKLEALITKREDKYQTRKSLLDAEQRDLTNAYGTMIIPMREKRDKLEDKKRKLERELEATSMPDRRAELRKKLGKAEKKVLSVQKAESKVELKFERNMNLWQKKQNKLGADFAMITKK